MKSSAGHWSASPHGNSARYSSIAHQRGEGGKLAERNILIQPMSIGHTDLHGIPVGRQHRPLVVWYGDLDFMPHIKAFVARGAVNAVVSYGSRPTPYPTAKPRRNRCGAVRALNAATVRGRPRTAHATTS